jgi:hypothetical protein
LFINQEVLLIILILIISYLPYDVVFVIEHLRVSAFPYVAMILAAISFP